MGSGSTSIFATVAEALSISRAPSSVVDAGAAFATGEEVDVGAGASWVAWIELDAPAAYSVGVAESVALGDLDALSLKRAFILQYSTPYDPRYSQKKIKARRGCLQRVETGAATGSRFS